MTTKLQRYELAAQRVAVRFDRHAKSHNLKGCMRELINATRLWNLADHWTNDADPAWRILRRHCPWAWGSRQFRWAYAECRKMAQMLAYSAMVSHARR